MGECGAEPWPELLARPADEISAGIVAGLERDPEELGAVNPPERVATWDARWPHATTDCARRPRSPVT